jgi:hypothetical protein
MPPAARANAAMSPPRSRAARACASSTRCPNARVVYVSATGATTVHNLAYAQRLGLWGGEDFPFATRAEFVEAIEAGGVAAMEVLARDLRRSASTPPARSPMTASNTSWSSTR